MRIRGSAVVRGAGALRVLAVMIGFALAFLSSPAAAVVTTPDALLDLSNAVRAEHGVAPVTRAPGVDAVAQSWAQHLADTDAAASNPWASDQLPEGWSAWGENIASGAESLPPEAMHDLWVASPEHLANIIDPAYTVVGLGYAVSASGTAYGVELFARYDDVVAAEVVPEIAPIPDDVPAVAEPSSEGPASSGGGADGAAAPDRSGSGDGLTTLLTGETGRLIALGGACALSASVSVLAFARVRRSRRN